MLIFLTFYHHVTITYPNLFLGIIGRKTIPAPRSGKYTHTWVRGCLHIHNYKYTKSLDLPVKCVLSLFRQQVFYFFCYVFHRLFYCEYDYSLITFSMSFTSTQKNFGFYVSAQAVCEGQCVAVYGIVIKRISFRVKWILGLNPALPLISVSFCLKSSSWVCCQN